VRGECLKPRAWVEGARGEKPGITLPTSAIGLGVGVLLALILMETNFCVYFSGCIMVGGS